MNAFVNFVTHVIVKTKSFNRKIYAYLNWNVSQAVLSSYSGATHVVDIVLSAILRFNAWSDTRILKCSSYFRILMLALAHVRKFRAVLVDSRRGRHVSRRYRPEVYLSLFDNQFPRVASLAKPNPTPLMELFSGFQLILSLLDLRYAANCNL